MKSQIVKCVSHFNTNSKSKPYYFRTQAETPHDAARKAVLSGLNKEHTVMYVEVLSAKQDDL